MATGTGKHQVGLMFERVFLASGLASGGGAVLYLIGLALQIAVHDNGDESSLGIALVMAIPIWFLVAMMAFITGAPCLALVCAPLTWPFRRSIVRHPLLWAILLAGVGAALGRASVWLSDKLDNSAFDSPDYFGQAAYMFGSVFAVSWVYLVWRARGQFSSPSGFYGGLSDGAYIV